MPARVGIRRPRRHGEPRGDGALWARAGQTRTEQPRTRPAPLCVLSRVSVRPVHKHGDEKKVGARREPVTAVFVSGLNFNGTGRLESRAFCAQQSENVWDRGWGGGGVGGTRPLSEGVAGPAPALALRSHFGRLPGIHRRSSGGGGRGGHCYHSFSLP